MRVLDTETLQVRYKQVDEKYAILSHVWGKEEVTFQDIQNLDNARLMAGFTKLVGAASLAKSEGYACIWIDTCCIDKSSSAELSEAINSMYTWYELSDVCYAYLSDLESGNSTQSSAIDFDVEASFRESRWFCRGWTLQELIAPSDVQFYAKDWTYVGTKNTLKRLISAITGIDIYMLEGGDPFIVSIARRMSWASGRLTTRVEDIAYCLMGLFGVNMPLLYGEDNKAFLRLQEEIMKISSDQSLFIWNLSDEDADHEYYKHNSLLARSPNAFLLTGKNVPLLSAQSVGTPIASVMTNRGIQIKLGVVAMKRTTMLIDWEKMLVEQPIPTHLGVLASAYGPCPGTFAALRLARIGDDSTFHRVGVDIDTVKVSFPPAQYVEHDTLGASSIKWHYQSHHEIVDSKTIPLNMAVDWTEAKKTREVTIVSNEYAENRQPPPLSVSKDDSLEILTAWPMDFWDPGTSTMFWPTHFSPGPVDYLRCNFLLQYRPDNTFRREIIGLCLCLRYHPVFDTTSDDIDCDLLDFFKVKETQTHETRTYKEDTEDARRLIEMMRAWANNSTTDFVVEPFAQRPPFKVSLRGFGVPGYARVILYIGRVDDA